MRRSIKFLTFIMSILMLVPMFGCASNGEGGAATTPSNPEGTSDALTDAPDTQAPETDAPETNAPETNAPEAGDTTTAPETEAPAKEGCGSVIGFSAVAILAAAAAAVALKKD